MNIEAKLVQRSAKEARMRHAESQSQHLHSRTHLPKHRYFLNRKSFRVDPPAILVGDVHGQLFDMLEIMNFVSCKNPVVIPHLALVVHAYVAFRLDIHH